MSLASERAARALEEAHENELTFYRHALILLQQKRKRQEKKYHLPIPETKEERKLKSQIDFVLTGVIGRLWKEKRASRRKEVG